MTTITALSPHFAADATIAERGFMPKWGEVFIFKAFLPLRWEISFILN